MFVLAFFSVVASSQIFPLYCRKGSNILERIKINTLILKNGNKDITIENKHVDYNSDSFIFILQ